jgi:CubicO group peptidase (beta-lactamase class C family)
MNSTSCWCDGLAAGDGGRLERVQVRRLPTAGFPRRALERRSRLARAQNPAMDAAALRAWLDEQVVLHAFRGVALVWGDGAPEFSFAGGIANRGQGVPITEGTRFAVASITKLATAVTVLRLVDRGLVQLDQPLADILPPEHRPTALTNGHTLHHLLSHTSGLANYHDDTDQTWASFTSAWDRIPTYRIRRPADMLPLFRDLPAVRPPGQAFEYADANFILVGLVIEAITGRPWSDVAADEVFAPAGMSDTAIEALDDDPPRVATGYLTDDGPPERWRSNVFSVPATGMPDGGMITTARDLAVLIDALLGGGLLSPPLLAAMTRPQGPPSTAVEQYGYGCELVVEDGEVTVLGHGGGDPGVSTMVAHYPAAATTIVVLCNQDRGNWAASVHIAAALGLPEPRGF